MNWQHLRAFLWLRWRLRVNQLKRSGVANAVMLAFLTVGAILLVALVFLISLTIGLYGLNNATPDVLMYIFDGMVVAFLLLWAAGLLTELRRSEGLSLEKFLHLPVSLSSAFLINYLSSLPSVNFVWFSTAMLGLSSGLIYRRGLAMLWLLPMLAAFLLMVTALTYQLQGWLATLMSNPRRQRTIIAAATMVFVLLLQVPYLVNILYPWERALQPELQANLAKERQELERDRLNGTISPEEYKKRQVGITKQDGDIRSANEAIRHNGEIKRYERIAETARLINLLLPPGWLPAGIEATAAGRSWPILLAILGPMLIGTVSLWRAYGTTVRLYTGQYTSGRTAANRPVQNRANRPVPAVRVSTQLLERKLPWLSEQATIITLAAFRSLLRAPEAKMLLLSPVLLLILFSSMFLASGGRTDLPDGARPFLGFGAMVVVLFSMSHLLGNQFGFDRDGFRVFVLSPARRRDILLGKNLAVAPIAMTLGAAAAVLMQVCYPMRLDRFLALAPRFVSMYLLYCLTANILSILVPVRIAPNSFQPAKPGAFVVLLHMLFMFLCPSVLALTLLPVLIELAFEAIGLRHGIPIDLLLSLAECAAIIVIYGLLLKFQGDWLQAREQTILQIVTTRTE